MGLVMNERSGDRKSGFVCMVQGAIGLICVLVGIVLSAGASFHSAAALLAGFVLGWVVLSAGIALVLGSLLRQSMPVRFEYISAGTAVLAAAVHVSAASNGEHRNAAVGIALAFLSAAIIQFVRGRRKSLRERRPADVIDTFDKL